MVPEFAGLCPVLWGSSSSDQFFWLTRTRIFFQHDCMTFACKVRHESKWVAYITFATCNSQLLVPWLYPCMMLHQRNLKTLSLGRREPLMLILDVVLFSQCFKGPQQQQRQQQQNGCIGDSRDHFQSNRALFLYNSSSPRQGQECASR